MLESIPAIEKLGPFVYRYHLFDRPYFFLNKASARKHLRGQLLEILTRCPDCDAFCTDDGYSIDERCCYYCSGK